MKQLTEKEESVMKRLWMLEGEVIARDIWNKFPEPRPNFCTLVSYLRILEQKGLVKHRPIGNTNLYRALVSKEDFGKKSLKSAISKFFNGSLAGMVSSLLKNEELDHKEINELLDLVEKDDD